MMISTSKNIMEVLLVLLYGEHDKFYTLSIKTEEKSWWDVESLTSEASKFFGAEVRTLRCIDGDKNVGESCSRAYALEFLNPLAPPPKDLSPMPFQVLSLNMAKHAISILEDLIKTRQGTSSITLLKCEPWIQKEWHKKAENFLFHAIPETMNIPQKLKWKQLRAWPRSYIYEIRFQDATYVLKACPPAYSSEVPLTAYLAKNYSSLVPNIIACDFNNHFLLSDAFKGKEVSVNYIPIFELAAKELAKMQYEVSQDLTELSAIGLNLRNLSDLKKSFQKLIKNDLTFYGLTDLEIKELHASTDFLLNSITRLQSIGLPLSIEHGDFRAANILYDPIDGFRIIDWSESSVAHPFFSIAQLVDEEKYDPNPIIDCEIKNLIIQSYLGPWEALNLPRIKLEEAVKNARLLMPIFKAVERYETLLPNLAYPMNWNFSVAFWLRRFLIQLKDNSKDV